MASLELYREFIVFSEYMSYSKAAGALYTTQSNLSKHMSQMEDELGFSVIERRGNRLSLTDAGAHFLSGIQAILEERDELLMECRQIEKNKYAKLSILDISWVDKASVEFFNIVNVLREEFTNTQIRFVHVNFRDLHEELLLENIDIVLEYHCASKDHIVEEYKQKGLYAIQIFEEPLMVWGKRYLFEGHETVAAESLRDISIMTPNDISYPLKYILYEISEFLGFKPRIYISTAGSPTQFYFSSRKKSVYLLQESYVKTELFESRNDMRALPFTEPILCKMFVVISQMGKHFEKIKTVLEDFYETEPR